MKSLILSLLVLGVCIIVATALPYGYEQWFKIYDHVQHKCCGQSLAYLSNKVITLSFFIHHMQKKIYLRMYVNVTSIIVDKVSNGCQGQQ